MDTATGVWSKASDSPLPFMGRAEYAPELGLWFGWDRGLLCAWDLKSAGAGAAPMECKLSMGSVSPPVGGRVVRPALRFRGAGAR